MPFSDYYVILNPAADRGRARRHVGTIRDAFRRAGARAEVAMTVSRGHGAELAAAAARAGQSAVVAVGGDGIVHEVANGLMRAANGARTVPMGVIAAGSGNDFVKMLGTPTEISGAVARIVAGEPRAVDLGEVSRWVTGEGRTHPWYFTNGIGLGFDAQVAVQASRIRRLRGMAIYAAAVARVLRDLRTPRMRVTVDGEEIANRPLILTTISNGACHGGSFWMCPNAIIDDGLFEVLIADGRSVFEVMKLIPRVMRGTHLGAAGVEVRRGKVVSVSSDEPLPIHADGEIVGSGVREIEMRILPGRLMVLG